MISVCYPCRDDVTLLKEVVANLCLDQDPQEFEVIICDDGSKATNGQLKPITKDDFPQENVRIINNGGQYGVGYAFDRCVEASRGMIIVLAGSDTFTRRSWLQSVKNSIVEGEIGCCASVGLKKDERNLDNPQRYVRYGADLLYTVSNDELPQKSQLRNTIGGYTALFEAKWAEKKFDEPYEIPCILGAFYWTTKAFYEKIHGWDTERGVRFQGHQNWGSLEPYISLKTKVYGGKLRIYPDFEVGHVFGRIATLNLGNFEISTKRIARGDLHWWNRLFMVHTMTEDPLKTELLNFPHKEYNLSMAEKYILDNFDKVEKIRGRNKREGILIKNR